MNPIDPIIIGDDAINALIRCCQQNGMNNLTLVADDNTFAALGSAVEAAFKAAGFSVNTIVLSGTEVIADEHFIMQVLTYAPVREHTFISIGSGTLTDITRFASHRTRNPFIAMPTAPSVDGFTSIGAPVVLGGIKVTLTCHAPLAVFAHLPTLQAAPRPLIAAGFGDIVGKLTSLADWKLGHWLRDEPYDETIARRARLGLETCLSHAGEIGSASREGIRYLMDALIESGLCMLELGSSHPASGAEHHCSHYWEMLLLQASRPALLHGAKVGFATSLIAGQYHKIAQISHRELLQRLEAAQVPDYDTEVAAIRRTYGPLANPIIQGQKAFLEITPEQFETLKSRIIAHWEDILQVARDLPSAEAIRQMLSKVGAPTDADALKLSQDEVRDALQYGHFLRDRFTVMKLSHILGISLLPGAI